MSIAIAFSLISGSCDCYVAIINVNERTVYSSHFNIPKININDVFDFIKTNDIPISLKSLKAFLLEHAFKKSQPQIIFSIDIKVIPPDDIILSVMGLLNKLSLAPMLVRTYPENIAVILDFPISAKTKKKLGKQRPPLYIYRNVSDAYGYFLFNKKNIARNNAIYSAYIATNATLYYFLTGSGAILSASDIKIYLNLKENKKKLNIPEDIQIDISGVFSGLEYYKLFDTENTLYDKINDIPLEYALASKEYDFIKDAGRENDNLKFAVLSICKKWQLCLHSSSIKDGLLSKKIFETNEPIYQKNKRFNDTILLIKKIEEQDGTLKEDILLDLLNDLSNSGQDVSQITLELYMCAAYLAPPIVYDPRVNEAHWIENYIS
ncbi:MAG: hypothetical protein JWP44_3732 [Mucilaginibacter sp.]|nr:hypothetical protein [Mucilaginibacter sp.]